MKKGEDLVYLIKSIFIESLLNIVVNLKYRLIYISSTHMHLIIMKRKFIF